MAKLELPIQAFVADFFRRAFPDRDFSRGSAARSLLLGSMSAILQPLRHEIDALKVNQSVLNYRYMSREDLDALAANWGKFRQSGGRSYGRIRIYFNRLADYELTYLEFYATDGSTYVLQSSVSISVRELMTNRLSDGTSFYDVAVQSVGVGNRYALAAGSIVGLRNGPPYITRAENLEDFQVTAPDESNYDVANAMFRNLTMRNLVSRAAIRVPILDSFPGILDVFVAGADHPSMRRDLVNVRISGRDVELHLGGMTDIWLNTNSVAQREVVFSYLPTSKEVRIVSADQAQATELLYSFARLLLDADGRYASPDSEESLDESSVVSIDQAGIPYDGNVVSAALNRRYRLAARDILSANDLIALPIPGNDGTAQAHLLTDILSLNLGNTPTAEGDMLQHGTVVQRIQETNARVVRPSPEILPITTKTYDTANGTVVAGDRFVPLISTTGVRVNDRAVITQGGAAGHYRVLAVDGSGVWLGLPRARVELTWAGTEGTNTIYQVTAVGGGTPALPVDVDETHWFSFADDGGYGQSGTWVKVVSVLRGATLQVVLTGGPAGGPHVATLVAGLHDALANQTLLYFEAFSRTEQVRSVLQPFTIGHTHYINALAATLPAGATSMSAPGIGLVAIPGSLILFDAPGTIPTDRLAATGGDGTKFSVFVEEVWGPDEVIFAPALPADLQAGLRYAVMRNDKELATVTADAVSGNRLTVNSWPLGLGDGLGMAVLGTKALGTGIPTLITALGAVTRVTISGLSSWTDIRTGDTLALSGTGGTADGTRAIVRVDDVAHTVDVAGTLTGAGGTAVVSGSRLHVIASSTGGDLRTLTFKAPQQARTLTFQAGGYVTVAASAIGAAVRQKVGATTYAGILHSIDNAARTWTVVPNDPTVDLFVTSTTPGEEVFLVNTNGTGFCTNTGTLVPVRYFSPAPSDVGKLVRQGSYTGVLDSYEDAPNYRWFIKPTSEFDLFDRTDATTFVDRLNNGEPTAGAAQGTLLVSASQPEVNGGSVEVNLDRAASFTASSSVKILSRFGRHGAMVSNGSLKVWPEGSVNGSAFTTVDPEAHEVLMLLGDNFDAFVISEKSAYQLELGSGAAVSEFVRIANAPTARQLALAAPVMAGATTITSAGSHLGVWGHDGRILLLTANGVTYHLTIAGPAGSDGVTLRDPVPVALFPNQSIEYEVVEGYNLPYLIVAPAARESYRIVRAPDVGDVLHQGTQGYHSSLGGSNDRFVDAAADFRTLFGFHDWTKAAGELLLFIDDGLGASTEPKRIVGLLDERTLAVDPVFDTTDGPVGYHIVRKNAMVPDETWLRGIVTGPSTVVVDVEDGWDPSRFGTLAEWQVDVYPAPGEPGALTSQSDIAPLTIQSYNVGSKTMTFDVTHVAEVTTPGVFDTGPGASPRGFQPGVTGLRVRLFLSPTSRVATLRSSGTVYATYNYYAQNYFTLPLVRIQKVQALDPQSLQPTRDLPFRLQVEDAGLRYNHQERNVLAITEESDDAVFQPFKVTYLCDPSIEEVHRYVNEPDTRVVNGNSMVKRMETMSVSISVQVRTEKSEAELRGQVAAWVNGTKSTQSLTKDGLVKYLYQQELVSFIDIDTLRIDAVYYRADGEEVVYDNVSQVFGSDTACYVSNEIVVTRLAPGVTA